MVSEQRQKIKKIVKNWLIFVVIIGWIFAGWPKIDDFSPETKRASAAVPSGVIVAWPSTDASIPSGWARVTDLDTYYLEGTTSDPSSSPGGQATHTHTDPGHTHTIGHSHSGTTGGAAGANATQSGTGLSIENHTHAITTDASSGSNNSAAANFDTASNDPPYAEVIWIKSQGTTDIPAGAWALFDSDSLPSSWARVNGNRFLKGAAASGDGGSTGGSSDSHNHTDLGHTHTESAHTHTGTTDADSGTSTYNKSGTGDSLLGHVHTISGGDATATETEGYAVIADADGQPPWYKLNIIQNNTGGADLPLNTIAMWDGTIANIPSGWELCDGSGTCPNLNDKFIKGANADSEIDGTGGALTHTHDPGTAHHHAINSHTHNFTVEADATSQGKSFKSGGTNSASATHTHTLSITQTGGNTGDATVSVDDNTENRPPYKEIVFIMYTGVVAVSISLNTDGAVDFDHLALSATQDNTASGINDVEVLSIDSGPADLDIESTNFTEGGNTWTLGASNGSNQVKWEFATSTSNWVTFAVADNTYEMDLNVAQSATRNIYLRITMPSFSDSLNQYSASITITGSAP